MTVMSATHAKYFSVCVGFTALLLSSSREIVLQASWQGFKELAPHLSIACSPLVRQKTSSTQQSDSFGPIFSVSLWYSANICGLHDLVIPPQWAPFGFGPLVAPFGVYTHTHTHTHTCTLVNNHSCLVEMWIFQCGFMFLAWFHSLLREYVWFVWPYTK